MFRTRTQKFLFFGLCATGAGVSGLSRYFEGALQRRVMEQPLCKGAVGDLLAHGPSLEVLGPPVEVRPPNLRNGRVNRVSATEAVLVLPVLGTRRKGLLVVSGEKAEQEEEFKRTSLRLRIDDKEADIIPG